MMHGSVYNRLMFFNFSPLGIALSVDQWNNLKNVISDIDSAIKKIA